MEDRPSAENGDLGRQIRLRKLQSCAECRRRKIKCDRRVPCRACSERGDGAFCSRAPLPQAQRTSDLPAGNSSHADVDALKSELGKLRRRLERVEGKIGLDDDSEPNPKNDDIPDCQESGLAGAMEDAAFNIGQVRKWQDEHRITTSQGKPHHEAVWFEPMPFSLCLAALPSQTQSEALVEAFLSHCNWFCAWLHGPTFRRMHREFWTHQEQGVAEDTMFLALLFAVLSNAAFLLSEQQASEAGHDLQSLRQLASLWFDCSFASFFRCNGLAEPSLEGVQAMVTLNYAFHLSGNYKIHQSMFSVNIGMARRINLHLLGAKKPGTIDEIMQQEMGRRAWWALVEADWCLTPHHRYSYVAPHSFNTALPDLTDDSSSVSSDPDSVCSLSYLLAACRSGKVLYNLYGTLAPYENPSYDSVLAASKEIDAMISSYSRLKPSAQTHTSHLYMKRLIGMTLAYRSYLVHRTYFVKSLSNPSLSETYRACVRAAEIILDLSEEGIPDRFYRLWNITIWMIAAGIIIALDLIQGDAKHGLSRDHAKQRLKLENLVAVLRTKGDRTGIGARGANLIHHLSTMVDDTYTGGYVSLANITRKDVMGFASVHNTAEQSSHKPYVRPVDPSQITSGHHESVPDSTKFDGADVQALEDLIWLPPSWVGNPSSEMQAPLSFTGMTSFEENTLSFLPDMDNS